MTSTTMSTSERIRALNDAFRRTFVGGAVMITAGVEAMPIEQRRSLLQKVRAFDAFTDDNDPHREHDFGAIDEGGIRCFWKIEYYDPRDRDGLPRPRRSRRHHTRADDHARRRILSQASNAKGLQGVAWAGATHSSSPNHPRPSRRGWRRQSAPLSAPPNQLDPSIRTTADRNLSS